MKYARGMRRVLVTAPLLGALGACTTFDFAAPTGESSLDGGPVDATSLVDAGLDARLEGGADGGGGSLLDLPTAARLCALTFDCPGLGQAIESSLVIPVATPASPLNFSGCVDWLAGPIDPGRIGLAEQQQILRAIAAPADASACAAAYASSPIHPVDAGATCAATSCNGTALETCSAEGAFTVTCGAPLFDQPGTCVVPLLSTVALCETKGKCAPGGSCSSSTTYVDCYKDGTSYTAYDCTLSGRQCVDEGAPDCVVPGKLAAPCPARGINDTCDGTSVLHCSGGLLAETEFDCSATQRTCSVASGVARCVGAGDACTPFDGDVNTCSGTSIGLCVAGRKTSFDCESLGLSCVDASATQTAHCG